MYISFLIIESSSLKNIGQLICVFFLFIFVLFLAYMAARISGSIQSNSMNKKSNIKVIEVYRISNTKVIEIVQIGSKYFALSICKDDVKVITELSEDEITKPEVTLQPLDFNSVFEKFKNKNQKENNK